MKIKVEKHNTFKLVEKIRQNNHPFTHERDGSLIIMTLSVQEDKVLINELSDIYRDLTGKELRVEY